MSKFVSINCKYYKHSNKNELNHVARVHKKVENSKPELVHNNFGINNLELVYDEVYKKVENYKGKKLQKNANTYIDSVLSFDRDLTNKIIKDFGREKFQIIFEQKINELMLHIKNKLGFEPIGFKFHADEGHNDPVTGEWNQNYHAHIAMFNFDFKDGTAPLRKMQKGGAGDFALLQDLAYQAFSPLGYERGVSKTITKKVHLEKDEYIQKKQLETIELLESNYKSLNESIDELKKVENNISIQSALFNEINIDMQNYDDLLNDLMRFKLDTKKILERLNNKSLIPKLKEFIIKNVDKEIYKKVEKFINYTPEQFAEKLDLLRSVKNNDIKKSINNTVKSLTNEAEITKLKVEKLKRKFKL